MRRLPDLTRIAVRLTHYQPELGFIYHHNAKAASTTTNALLRKLLDRYAATLSAPERGSFRGLLSGPAHWESIVPVLNAPSVYRFSFVRHPVSRAVSTFNNFFVEAQNAYTKRHRFTRRSSGLKMYDASADNFERFLDFSEEVIAEDPALCDLHIRTQTRNLLVEHLPFRRIGKMETWKDDMQAVLRDVGLYHMLRDDDWSARENASVSGNRLRRPTDKQIERIGRIYSDDFSTFGYQLAY